MNIYSHRVLNIVTNGLISPTNQSIFVYNPFTKLNYTTDECCYEHPELVDLADSVAQLNKEEELLLVSRTSHSVIDVEAGKKFRDIYEHDGVINAVCWSPINGNVFASVGSDNTVRLWDIRQHPAQVMIIRLKRYSCLDFSPDGQYLALGGDNAVNLMYLNNPRDLTTMKVSSPVTNVKFNPLECTMATISTDKVVRFWDIDAKECVSQTLPFDTMPKAIEYTSCGNYFVAASDTVLSSFLCEPLSMVHEVEVEKVANHFLDFKIAMDVAYHLSWNSDGEVVLKSYMVNDLRKNGVPESPVLSAISPIKDVVNTEDSVFYKSTNSMKTEDSTIELRSCMSRSSSLSSNHLSLHRSRNNSQQNLTSAAQRKTSVDLGPSQNSSAIIKEHNSRLKKGSDSPSDSLRATQDGFKSVVDNHPSVMAILRERMHECKRIQSMSRISSIDDTLKEASKMNGSHMLAALINTYKASSSPTITFYSKVLLYVIPLLRHTNPDYINIGLDIVCGVLTDHGDQIKTGSKGNTDLENACNVCKRMLTEVYILMPCLLERLNEEQRQTFTSLLPLLKALAE
ncbi:unnamed protein product [Bursaphelenchus okinawaensis]|uniref:WD_REPEATS_REGION domain-containing protein n=1 Tax=Bursaphelenchus okinawaensis TaxID=465554 RepID=A0A811JTX9_9BILA|nr:unnamed protein product [Bursaphelenchus okinawaensis]CAG9082302.1 unnamed protein product [Bursaphelenchus okinawaensis]